MAVVGVPQGEMELSEVLEDVGAVKTKESSVETAFGTSHFDHPKKKRRNHLRPKTHQDVGPNTSGVGAWYISTLGLVDIYKREKWACHTKKQ